MTELQNVNVHLRDTDIDFIKKLEGLELKPYLCSAGKWTIGYGHVIQEEDGIGDEITQEEAEEILRQDILKYAFSVRKQVKVDLSPNQFAALVSFCFNIGITNFSKSSVLKTVNAGLFSAVPERMKLYKYVTVGQKKVVNEGLIKRRQKETNLWNRAS